MMKSNNTKYIIKFFSLITFFLLTIVFLFLLSCGKSEKSIDIQDKMYTFRTSFYLLASNKSFEEIKDEFLSTDKYSKIKIEDDIVVFLKEERTKFGKYKFLVILKLSKNNSYIDDFKCYLLNSTDKKVYYMKSPNDFQEISIDSDFWNTSNMNQFMMLNKLRRK